MASDEIAFLRQANAAFLFQHAQGRNCVGHDRWLRIFGKREFALRTLAHQTKQMLAECFVNFFKHCARDRAGFGEYFAHANGLAALPRKYKCAHGYSCRSVIVQNRLWCSVECCKPERHNPVIGVMANIRVAQIVDTCSCAPAPGDFFGIFAKGAIIFGHIADAAKP